MEKGELKHYDTTIEEKLIPKPSPTEEKLTPMLAGKIISEYFKNVDLEQFEEDVRRVNPDLLYYIPYIPEDLTQES